MDDPRKHNAKQKHPVPRDHTWCDSVDMKCPDRANPSRKKIGCQGLGVQGSGLPTVTEFLSGVATVLWNEVMVTQRWMH